MLALLHAPYHLMLINSSILLLISHKSAQVTQPNQSQVGTSHTAKRHGSSSRDNWDRPRDITPSSGDGLCPGRATGQETLLRHQETACVQGEPQANINELQDTKQNINFLYQRPLPILAIFHEQCNLANNEARHRPEWTFLQKNNEHSEPLQGSRRRQVGYIKYCIAGNTTRKIDCRIAGKAGYCFAGNTTHRVFHCR